MTESTYKFTPVRDASPANARASLVFAWGEQVHAVALGEGQARVVGRAEPAQVVIEDKSLSRTHARVGMRDGRVHIEDLASTNGTTVNGQAVREAFLAEGDTVCLGAVDLRVTGIASVRTSAPQWISLVEWTESVTRELARCRSLGRAFAVLAVRSVVDTQPDLPLRDIDLACQYAPRLSLVLLPEARSADLTGWIERLRKRGLVSNALGGALAPEHGASAEALLGCALEAARRAKVGGGCEVAEVRLERRALAAPVVMSPCMVRLYEMVARAARANLPVLVLGETGSGKEHVAQAVHQRSPRAKGPFKTLNCATIPGNLIESVLFGHERGAFTGADKQALGLFEQAQGGTVFLDEVGELSEKAQAALLRVLETKRIVRVGGNKELDVDVRIVAATHRDLSAMVAQGSFREDLMFRLDALSLRVPPLRERREEIAPLARLFLERAREDWNTQASSISLDALDALEAYRWPGNVRQLKNTMERAAAVCAGTSVELEDLSEQVLAAPEGGGGSPEKTADAGFRSLPDRVREFEAGLIREALEKAHGNQAQAARILGVPRRTLAHKAHALGVVG